MPHTEAGRLRRARASWVACTQEHSCLVVPGRQRHSGGMSAPSPAPARLAVVGGRVHRAPGRVERTDLYTDGPVIVDAPAPADLTIDAGGASVVPLLVESVLAGTTPPDPDAFDLVPGNPATFAVLDGPVSADRITRMLVADPAGLRAVVVDGTVVVRDGAALRPRGTTASGAALAADDPRLGAWHDARRDMTQHLTPDGRYSETRGGVRDAYTGSFWLDGDRITYLDDTGFWAFGQYHAGVLHHAGFVLRLP
ncbi:hypothetical protein GCM10010102_40380 [Promicromonospora citrea]|uniref:Uncharacterized protein n=2 Tax=Promicromonospora citrea TaxID=43677 RepID=A0A8H9GP47_9MICO|nr:hypothetical protein GCM10010102_40380 [Promicromonospora citrea]